MNPDASQGLYRPEFEHDACGTGFITYLNGRKTQQTITDALTMLENMEHRGACGCDSDSGDGAGLLIQIPHWFLLEECVGLNIRLPSRVAMAWALPFCRRMRSCAPPAMR
jgi:glutamate synthase (NADPH/NADH) large chain